ncbi:outer membrane protein [Histidinibacterium aquaticum]|uniref:Outer membrane beta-barrel protein n=1 Tax=Histidinibacterium aquaticum TaxID=2613962 RepID=A0A5J5GF80_9RHOB|nr:outer membrane beta-barrel protein [Histidinibacterium aquaticum]KAA9006660.1 outer membrane beta-barrel protein [Histidinibacterium aquaticum]
MRHQVPSALVLLAASAVPAAAEVELSFYLGAQSAPHSRVYVDDDPLIPDEDFLVGWEGRSFSPPPYYGFRATWWQSDRLGYGLDFTHSKVYGGDDVEDAGYDTLEFTDGLNIATANVYYRWPERLGPLTPYVGAGAGIAVPHVEVEKNGSSTYEYQYTGPAVTLIAGASYPLSDSWAVFGELKSTMSWNEAELSSGGTLESRIVTNALNVGVSYNF